MSISQDLNRQEFTKKYAGIEDLQYNFAKTFNDGNLNILASVQEIFGDDPCSEEQQVVHKKVESSSNMGMIDQQGQHQIDQGIQENQYMQGKYGRSPYTLNMDQITPNHNYYQQVLTPISRYVQMSQTPNQSQILLQESGRMIKREENIMVQQDQDYFNLENNVFQNGQFGDFFCDEDDSLSNMWQDNSNNNNNSHHHNINSHLHQHISNSNSNSNSINHHLKIDKKIHTPQYLEEDAFPFFGFQKPIKQETPNYYYNTQPTYNTNTNNTNNNNNNSIHIHQEDNFSKHKHITNNNNNNSKTLINKQIKQKLYENQNETEFYSQSPKLNKKQFISQKIQMQHNILPPPKPIQHKNHKNHLVSAERNLDIHKKDDEHLQGRSSRGLRALSVSVKDIVLEKKSSSYKDVAETLINEYNKNNKNVKSSEKDEQNVKRRVYDALNVLIAADVLKKKGKIVYCDENSKLLMRSFNKSPLQQKQELEDEIMKKKASIAKKKGELQEMIYKCLAIKNLIQRNKQYTIIDKNKPIPNSQKSKIEEDQRENLGQAMQREFQNEQYQKNANNNSNNEKISKVVDSEKVVNFPFIVLLTEEKQNSISLNVNKSKTMLNVLSKKPLNIFGDIDILLKMQLHCVSKDFINMVIPQEMLKYLSENNQKDD